MGAGGPMALATLQQLRYQGSQGQRVGVSPSLGPVVGTSQRPRGADASALLFTVVALATLDLIDPQPGLGPSRELPTWLGPFVSRARWAQMGARERGPTHA